MGIKAILAIVASTYCLVVSTASADDVALVTGDDYPPFTGTELPNRGLATEIVETAFERMGSEVSVDFKPWKRGFEDTKAGTYLATFPYGKNAEREETFVYSEPLYEVGMFFFKRADSEIQYTDNTDLAGSRVCLPIGFNPVRLEKLVEEGLIELDQPPDLESCFKMLERGRTDLVRTNDFIAWSVIDAAFDNREAFKMLEKPFRQSIEHLIIPRANPDADKTIASFNAALEELRTDGTLNEMLTRHLK